MLFLFIGAAPGSELADAIRAYEQLDYRGARVILLHVLDDSHLSDGDKIETLAYLGRVHAVLGEPVRAQRRFEAVLALDPEYAVAWEESPRIREVFALAKKEAERRRAAAVRDARKPPVEPKRRVSPPPPQRLPERARPSEEGPTSPRGPTSPPSEDESFAVWPIIGGVALAVTVGVVATVLAVSSAEDPRDATETWRLP